MSTTPLPLCAVMLLDFTIPPGEPQPEPLALNKRVHKLIGRALRGLPEDTRVAVQSGTSAVVCFVGDPEDALQAALVLRDQVLHHYNGRLWVRVGLNMGPVEVSVDAREQLRVTGEGVRQALEVRERAEPNEVLVSRSYHELLAQLNPDSAGRFVEQGDGIRPITYSAVNFESSVPAEQAPPRMATLPAPLATISSLDTEALQDVQDELERHIGPMARTLIRKIEPRAATVQELRDALAPAIAQPQAREAFIAGSASALARSVQNAHAGSDSTRQVDITPQELAVMEHTLQRFIGPMAPPVMRRELVRCLHFRQFVEALAASIGHAQQRVVFLQALQRALPQRAVPQPPLPAGSDGPRP